MMNSHILKKNALIWLVKLICEDNEAKRGEENILHFIGIAMNSKYRKYYEKFIEIKF